MRGLGSGNVDFRLRQSDFSADGKMKSAPWLGMTIAEVGKLERVLVVGSTLRKDHPLLAHRLRQGTKRGLQLNLINPFDDNLLMRIAHKAVVAPSAMPEMLAQVLKAVGEAKNATAPDDVRDAVVSEAARAIAGSLASGQSVGVFLGNLGQHHPAASRLRALAQQLAAVTGGRFGFLGEAANSVGGYLAGCVPFGSPSGLNAGEMFRQPLKAYLLLGVEPELDTHDPQQAMAALNSAELVVAMSPYQHRGVDYAQVLLPIAPFTETAGTFVNTEGTVQSFNGVVRPLGETRPAWKVLRVLGNLLGLAGFAYNSAEEVRHEVLGAAEDVSARLDNQLTALSFDDVTATAREGLERIAEVPPYAADALVRRARSLQQTRDAAPPVAWMNRALFEKLGLREGDQLRVRQDGGEALIAAAIDDKLPANCIRLATARPETSTLGPMFEELAVERVPAQRKVAV
jgi:NADH-quinone oxidoreductase subunit G